MIKKLFIVTILLAFASQSAFAFYGARPMGMGGAFTAIADDANAPYWNPAGEALNPEVSLTGSTLINNRNTFVADNVANLKLCYETEMNPFEWIAGVGIASVMAYESAKYLSDQGVVQKGWDNPAPATQRGQSMTTNVQGTQEIVSLTKTVKDAFKTLAKGVDKGVDKVVDQTTIQVAPRPYYVVPLFSPWYRPNYYQPRYWEPREETTKTKAQFAAGFSVVNDYNARPTINQNLNVYSLTLASGFEQRVAVGGNLNFYNVEKISSGVKGVGADLDLGVIAKPVEYIAVGLAAKGILTTDIKWQSGEKTRNQMIVNVGIAVKPIYSLTLAADADNILSQGGGVPTYHYGVECVLLPGLLARAGLNDGSKTAGLSLALGNLIVDYAILGGVYNRTQMFGATWRF